MDLITISFLTVLTSGDAKRQCKVYVLGIACPGALGAGLISSSSSLDLASSKARPGGAGGRRTITRQVAESEP